MPDQANKSHPESEPAPDQQKHAQESLGRALKAADAGDYELALEEVGAALALRPRSAPYTARSLFLLKLGNLESAAVAAEYAVELGPHIDHPWIMLGRVRQEQQRFEDAGHCFERAAQIKPEDSTLTLLASVALKYDPGKAARAARQALEINPDWTEATEMLEAAEKLLARDD